MAAREKGVGLKPSLCMILPLRNDADRVSLIFTQALEILPELTPRWNLVLFDDGSTDATGESLAELVRAYPQATVIHHSTAMGDNACFRRGARVTDGDLVLLRSSDCDLDLTGLHKMWKRASAHPLVVARSHGDAGRGRFTLAARKKERGLATGPALQLIERRALGPWLAGKEEDLQGYLHARRYPQHEVELRRCLASGMAPMSGRFEPQHCDAGDASGRPKRPNYLLRLKAFAMGE
ncbi:MAG TPA: glycosyltransferase [Pirellulales bacterium]|nr:glycosyltransferase [Pirellulales bacterium]